MAAAAPPPPVRTRRRRRGRRDSDPAPGWAAAAGAGREVGGARCGRSGRWAPRRAGAPARPPDGAKFRRGRRRQLGSHGTPATTAPGPSVSISYRIPPPQLLPTPDGRHSRCRIWDEPFPFLYTAFPCSRLKGLSRWCLGNVSPHPSFLTLV